MVGRLSDNVICGMQLQYSFVCDIMGSTMEQLQRHINTKRTVDRTAKTPASQPQDDQPSMAGELSPQAFYSEVVTRPDIRELLQRLAH
jgi:hypothetical protein